jgi:hypothetical protein
MRFVRTSIATMSATLALLIAAAPASAISRYNAWTMSCEEARGHVREEGAVILRFRSTFNPSIPRYGRFVDHQGFCAASEFADTVFIPTADTRSCALRECILHDFDDDFLLLRRR